MPADRGAGGSATGSRDPRVDAYIERSAEFARPILERLREAMHAACPEVQETMKWSAPYFEYRGPLCGMAAFKEHCALSFWKGSLIVENPSDEAMGQLGRITRLADLPPRRTLASWIRKAVELNEAGVKPPRAARGRKPPPGVPDDLREGLRRNPRARATFEAFSPSHKREYIEWIEEAKRAETRARRVAATLEWLAEGKSRHWKYR